MKTKIVSAFVLTLVLLPLVTRSQSEIDPIQTSPDFDGVEEFKPDHQDSFTTLKVSDQLKDHTKAEYDEDLSSVDDQVSISTWKMTTNLKDHTEEEYDTDLLSDVKLIEKSTSSPNDYSDVKSLNKSSETDDKSQLRIAQEPEKVVNKHKKISKPLQMKFESSEGNRVTAAMFFTGLLVWFTAVAYILD